MNRTRQRGYGGRRVRPLGVGPFVTMNTPPIVAFTGSPLTGPAPLTVTFTNASARAESYVWLRRGEPFTGTPTATNPVEEFLADGAYTITLQTTNAFGTASLTKTFYVIVGTSPPPPPPPPG